MILTDHEIRIAAEKWVAETDYPNGNATSFAAGVKFLMQKLQQTPCSTTLAFLEQQLKEVDANAQSGFETTNELFRFMELEASLRHVLKFIRKLEANANVR